MNLSFEKCRRCGRMMPGIRRPICPKCRKELEASYEEVRDFLKNNPDEGFRRTELQELADQSGVPKKDLELLIEEGMLELEGAQEAAEEEEEKKNRLLKDFQSSLKGDKEKKRTLSYGSERHGR